MALRQSVLKLMENKLDLSDKQRIDLERGVYNWCIEYATEKNVIKNWKNPSFVELYKAKARSVIANLDTSSYVDNKRLMGRMKDGEFLPHELPYMKPQNVSPDVWREVVDLKMKKDANIESHKLVPMTDSFKCSRCKKRECVYYEKQTRSADEPMQLKIHCVNCGNSWKM